MKKGVRRPGALHPSRSDPRQVRAGEVLGARWSEFDLDAALWVVPGDRIKAGRKRVVPLSPPAIAILKEMARHRPVGDDGSAHVFPGQKSGAGMSNMSLEMASRRVGFGDRTTVHELRSSFRDWAGDVSSYPRDVAEMALAHTIANKAEAAYRHGTALEKRR